MPGPPTYVVDMHHSKRRRIRLCCLPSKRCRCSCVVWGWSLYNIVESESDPLTFSKKNPSRANGRWTYIHPPSLPKICRRTSEEIGNTHTNVARIIVWFHILASWNAGRYELCSTYYRVASFQGTKIYVNESINTLVWCLHSKEHHISTDIGKICLSKRCVMSVNLQSITN